jgi:hypothetical protein
MEPYQGEPRDRRRLLVLFIAVGTLVALAAVLALVTASC